MKTCTKCGKELPATTEYFHRANHRKSGFRADCKECAKIRDAEYRKRILEQNKRFNLKFKAEKGIGYRGLHNFIDRNKPKQKYCSMCNQEKKLELANLSGEYFKDIRDFIRVCKDCHYLLDKDFRRVEL